MANNFAFEIGYVFCIAAEDTSRLVFLKHNTLAVYIDLQSIILANTKGTAQFDWNNNTTQFVDFTYNIISVQRRR